MTFEIYILQEMDTNVSKQAVMMLTIVTGMPVVIMTMLQDNMLASAMRDMMVMALIVEREVNISTYLETISSRLTSVTKSVPSAALHRCGKM